MIVNNGNDIEYGVKILRDRGIVGDHVAMADNILDEGYAYQSVTTTIAASVRTLDDSLRRDLLCLGVLPSNRNIGLNTLKYLWELDDMDGVRGRVVQLGKSGLIELESTVGSRSSRIDAVRVLDICNEYFVGELRKEKIWKTLHQSVLFSYLNLKEADQCNKGNVMKSLFELRDEEYIYDNIGRHTRCAGNLLVAVCLASDGWKDMRMRQSPSRLCKRH